MVHIRGVNTMDYTIHFKQNQYPSTTDVGILNITLSALNILRSIKIQLGHHN